MLKKKNEFPIHEIASSFYTWKNIANQDMRCFKTFSSTKIHFSVVVQLLLLHFFPTFTSFDIGNSYCPPDARPKKLVHEASLCHHINDVYIFFLG